jgi:hypothetical protein
MATSNAATNYLERRILDFIFKNNALSFASPGDSLYVGLATAVSLQPKQVPLQKLPLQTMQESKLQQQTGQLLGLIRLIRKQRRMQQT